MKKILLLLTATFLISLSAGTITAQRVGANKVATDLKSPITVAMAKKIGYYCRYNQRALSLFSAANPQAVQNRTDIAHRLLRQLEQHLDCAENFIITLYYNYGVEMSYFALKDVGFTIEETDIAEAIWRKEEAKQQAIAKKKKQEKGRALLARIEANDVFTKELLSVQPDIEFDIAELATSTVFNDKEEYMNYDYSCIISKDGNLSLKNFSDTLSYSSMQKFIYHYITDNNMGLGGYKAGCIEIDGKDIPVNSYVNIQFKEQRYKQRGYLELTIKKNKKTSRWEFVEDISAKLQSWAKEDAERMRYDLEAAIYNCSALNDLKGKLQLKIEVYRRVLKSNISDEIDLTYYFDMKYIKRGMWEIEYIPLKYNVSF